MSFLSVTFAGLPVTAYQDTEKNFTVTAKEVQLYNGDFFAAISNKKRDFPRSFDCYTEDYTEISNLADAIGTFGTLVIEGESFPDCYISDLGAIKEIVRGSGKFTYSIKFSKVDQH
jgi:hypothetical protein